MNIHMNEFHLSCENGVHDKKRQVINVIKIFRQACEQIYVQI